MGRLAYQRGQLSVKQPFNTLQVRLLPDLPNRLINSLIDGLIDALISNRLTK